MFSMHTQTLFHSKACKLWKYRPTFCLFCKKNNPLWSILVYFGGIWVGVFPFLLQTLSSVSPNAFCIVSRAKLSLDGKTSFFLRLHCYIFVVEYQYLSYWNSLERQVARIFVDCRLHSTIHLSSYKPVSSSHSKRQSSCSSPSYI